MKIAYKAAWDAINRVASQPVVLRAQSSKTFPVYNPANGEVMQQCAAGEKADIDLAVKAARRAFERGPWSRLTHGQRGKLIWKLADLIEEHLEEFAQIESLDNGKPLRPNRRPFRPCCSAN